jgi:DNA-binding NtrC family response regulator
MAKTILKKKTTKQAKERKFKKHTILIVDDEEKILESMQNLLSEDYRIITACDGNEALKIVNEMKNPQDNISLIISDQRMPGGISGLTLFELLKEIIPDTPRIILTAHEDQSVMIDSINKAKAEGFLIKPQEPPEMLVTINQAIETFELRQKVKIYKQILKKENIRIKESTEPEVPKDPDIFKNIVTKNKKMQDIFNYIEDIAAFDDPILITGETGTGKELIAQAIHKASKTQGNFVVANIAEIDPQFFADTLFGHSQYSFTDAKNNRPGLLQKAQGGIIFLDEIGELQMDLQAKMLRVIETKEYYHIGKDETVNTDARFILATNRNLNDMKETDAFRRDLFYRLDTHYIHLPPLRERKEDIQDLVDYFLTIAADKYGKEKPKIPNQLIKLLCNYDFPGNIRELRSMVFSAMSLYKEGELSPDVFLKKIERQTGKKLDTSELRLNVDSSDSDTFTIFFNGPLPSFTKMAKLFTDEALKRKNGNKSAAAKSVGLERSKFNRLNKESE